MYPRRLGWGSGLLALAWSLGVGPGAAQPPPETVDLTGALVAEDTGKPVAGATLTLRPTPGPPVGRIRAVRLPRTKPDGLPSRVSRKGPTDWRSRPTTMRPCGKPSPWVWSQLL